MIVKTSSLDYVFTRIKYVLQENYQIFYKRIVPETLSSSLANIVLNLLTELCYVDQIKRFCGLLMYDLEIEKHIDSKTEQNIYTKILNASDGLDEPDVPIPIFLKTK